MYLDTSVFTQSFEFLCCFIDVGYYFGGFVVVSVGRIVVVVGRP